MNANMISSLHPHLGPRVWVWLEHTVHHPQPLGFADSPVINQTTRFINSAQHISPRQNHVFIPCFGRKWIDTALCFNSTHVTPLIVVFPTTTTCAPPCHPSPSCYPVPPLHPRAVYLSFSTYPNLWWDAGHARLFTAPPWQCWWERWLSVSLSGLNRTD